MRGKRSRLPALCGVLLTCGAALAGCAPCETPTATAGLQYLGQALLAPNSRFAGTVVGGLSGISYDPGRDCYYVISDDRSANGPARFYTVRLSVSDRGIDGVAITAMNPLLDSDGHPFAPQAFDATPPVIPPDPEGIAFDAGRQRLYWSSEGERRTDGPRGAVLADPWVRTAGLDGSYLGRFTMPPQLAMSAQPTGPRRNTTLEGLTVTADGRMLFAAMEGPGYDDGPLPDRDHGALTRITAYRLDAGTGSGAPVAQYAYPLEPAPVPAKTNGLTDLVALSDTAFLVIERAFSDRPTVRLFRADIAGATDVLDMPALAGSAVTPMTKTLVADLSTTPGLDPLDNIEGLTLGPRLPDGRQTVVLVSDDNFSPREVTQFVAFAIPAD
ncbi:esterase-like activity of phytase family protein [Mycolicibacter heraklionensis]|uniref:esterase-like activity of phytase family protein n=1 Tax=Mycolicibacter heraklionensis TaxID=512402 RepID=UPI0009ED2C05|nr:esterase-like activity of phytase family protein [Mycolicibacter heraklionensis]